MPVLTISAVKMRKSKTRIGTAIAKAVAYYPRAPMYIPTYLYPRVDG